MEVKIIRANDLYEFSPLPAVGGFPLGAVTGSNSALPGTPRMYGIEASVKL